jgi:hypothetical protein
MSIIGLDSLFGNINEASLRAYSEPRRCPECAYCHWDTIGSEQVPSCSNAKTKLLDPPITFLEATTAACHNFEKRAATLTVLGTNRPRILDPEVLRRPPEGRTLEQFALRFGQVLLALLFIADMLLDAFKQYGHLVIPKQ